MQTVISDKQTQNSPIRVDPFQTKNLTYTADQ